MTKTDGHAVQGIVLAGAHAWDDPTKLSEFLRPLLPVVHSPLICHTLAWLRDHGVAQATICANGSSKILRRRLGDGASMGVTLSYYDDPIPRGTAGCARDASEDCQADTFVAVDGTIIPQVDLDKVLAHHADRNASLTVVAMPTGSNGSTSLSPTGIYVFSRRALERVRATGFQDTKEVLIPELHKAGECISTFVSDGPCPRVTDPGTYLWVNEWMLKGLLGCEQALPGYRRIGEALVHRQARVSATANLVGPVMIGPVTRVGANATIVGPATLGAGCVIEERAIVCRSVVWDRCLLGKGSTVHKCILANEAAVACDSSMTGIVHVCDRHLSVPMVQRLLPWRRRSRMQNPKPVPADIRSGGQGDDEGPGIGLMRPLATR